MMKFPPSRTDYPDDEDFQNAYERYEEALIEAAEARYYNY